MSGENTGEEPVLRFEKVGKTFGDIRALESVSFSVARGEFCVLLGASGSGKTTLLRSVNGLVAPSSGEIRVEGRQVTRAGLKSIRRRVAMVHQHFNLVARLSVARNVMAGAAADTGLLRCLAQWYPRELRRRACTLIARVGLDQAQLNRRASALSGGQQQRVAIARALIGEPAVILADEPVASLDPKIARDVLGLLRQAARERGVTVLCSLHQPDLARAFADRIVAMKDGVIVYDGPPGGLDETALDGIYGMEAGRPAAAAA